MSDKEVDINGKTYGENTRITFTAKNLIWVIGILVTGICTLATVGYFDIKSRVTNLDNLYKQKVEDEIELIMKEDREKREGIIETIGEMKGDIKVILDRTSRNNDHNDSHSGDNNNNSNNNTLNVPTNSIPNNNNRPPTNGANLHN